jgi:SAM-dependent methyltransferase
VASPYKLRQKLTAWQRDTAWNVFPYPCIGQFRFLDLSIGDHAVYPEIVSRLTSGQKYLDLGCCFGQDIRRLVKDGVPAENCYGCDLRLDFMELGYDLFLDKDKLKAKFIEGDVFNPDSELRQLEGEIDILHTAAFFHMFGLEQQKQIARRVVKLLRPQKDSLLVGRQVGNVTGGEFSHRTNQSSVMYRHNIETWQHMWKEIGDETGTQWDVQARLLEWPGSPVIQTGPSWHYEGARMLQFSVRRL